MHSRKRTLCLAAVVLSVWVSDLCIADQLSVDCWAIRGYRAGDATKYEEVDRKVQELVAKYSDPDSQGKIYLEALRVHVMTGMRRPLEGVKYAEKAEPLLTDPVSRAQLYISWGDVCQFKKPGATGNKLREVRRESATKYLAAMKIALDNHVPEKLGEGPGINAALRVPEEALLRGDITGVSPRSYWAAMKMTPEQRAKARQDYREAMKEYELHKGLISGRDCAKSLVVYLYRKVPYDPKEVRQLATEILQDPVVVDGLVKEVNVAVRKQMERAGLKLPDELHENLESFSLPASQETSGSPGDIAPRSMAPQSQSQPTEVIAESKGGPYSPWFIAGGCLVVVVLGVLFFVRRHQRSQGQGRT